MKQLKQITILAALLCITRISAQSIGHTYNSYINKAELSITDGKYVDALQQYEMAFATTKTEFVVDLCNACACAAKLKNTAKVLSLADRLAAKGVGENFFTKNIFRNYAGNAEFQEITAKAEQVKNEKALANKKYTDKLTEFLNLDISYNELRLTKYYHLHELPDTLQKLSQANMKNMISLIKKEGFYTEEKLGADIGNDTIIRTMRKFDIAVLHYLEMGNDKALIEDIKSILLKNLENGKIRYYHISSMIAMTTGIFGDIGEWAFKINDCKIYRKTTIDWQSDIEHYRDLYCMNSMNDFEKIISYKYSTDSDFDFKYFLIKSPVSDMEYFISAFNEIAKIKNCQS